MEFQFVGLSRDETGRDSTDTVRFQDRFQTICCVTHRRKFASMRVSPLVLLLFVMPVFDSGTRCAAQSAEPGGDQLRQQTTETPEKQAASSAKNAPKRTDSDQDQDRLEGIWVFVTLIDKQEDRILISGERMYWYVGEKTSAGSFTIDASKRPKHIDINIQDDDRKVAFRGIYKFQGDMLFMFVVEKSTARPTDFKGDNFKEGENRIMFLRGTKEIETGTYKATSNGDKWTLILDKTDRLTIKVQGRVVVEGTFIATKTELIVFSDEKILLDGKKNAKTGRYKWKLDGKKITFTEIDDDRTDRAKAMTATTWVRQD